MPILHEPSDEHESFPTLDSALLNEVKRTVRARIRSLREGRGMTQEHAAKRVGLDQSQWSKLESGKVDLDLDALVRIQAALSLHSIEELFGVMPSQEAFRPAR